MNTLERVARESEQNFPLRDLSVQLGSESWNRQCQETRDLTLSGQI